jgi:Nif-specific regulatory protein
VALPLPLLRSLTEQLRGAPPLDAVLRTLGEGARLQRLALFLVDAERQLISIVASHGLTQQEQSRGRYGYDEGVVGHVLQTLEPAQVRSIRADPRFLDRTGALTAGQDRSFACVPLFVDGEPVGALAAYQPLATADALDRTTTLLSIAGGLLVPSLQRVLERRGDERRGRAEAAPRRIPTMLGNSGAMQQVFELVHQVAGSPTTVLLTGESGTGKELVAAALHALSDRRRGPFVAINCAALPEGVVESELFGHERGAFTGAVRRREGRFELADGGTLFLDEIGDLSPATQVKLLRVLQERRFERVGGNAAVEVDVRIVTATSRDLEAMVAAGTFRADLYYRLAVFPIRLPPLRERGGDVLLLADHFIETCNKAHGRAVRRISTPAIDMLMSYHWPGNVRELENCIERAVLLAPEGVILGHHLPPSLQTAEASGTAPSGSLKDRLARVETEFIIEALKSTRGNMAAAARLLGVSERIVGLRVQRYGLDPRAYKRAPGSS